MGSRSSGIPHCGQWFKCYITLVRQRSKSSGFFFFCFVQCTLHSSGQHMVVQQFTNPPSSIACSFVRLSGGTSTGESGGTSWTLHWSVTVSHIETKKHSHSHSHLQYGEYREVFFNLSTSNLVSRPHVGSPGIQIWSPEYFSNWLNK